MGHGMRTRQEVASYIKYLYEVPLWSADTLIKIKGDRCHFGKVELMMLMDYIYGEPKNNMELLDIEGSDKVGV